MCASFTIGATRNIDLLKSKLDTEFALLENDGIKISAEISPQGEYTFLDYNLADYGQAGYSAGETRTIFRHYIANVIADVILNDWEKTLLQDIVRENFYYFSEEEQRIIFDYALQHLNHSDEQSDDAVIYYLGRKSKILQKILDYLHGNNHITIEGFIRFRLQDYIQELRAAAEKAVDDFMLEREYKEFIRLLKYFVEIQEPRMEKVQVIVRSSGIFKLLDQQGKNISSDYLDGFIVEMGDSEINYEDLLISALITIAPNEILLHFMENAKALKTIDTIKSVFGNRVRYCSGCELCLTAKKEKPPQGKKI